MFCNDIFITLGMLTILLSKTGAFLSGQWIKPFDYEKGLQTLCTDNNHYEVMRGRDSPLLNNLIRHPIMCQRNFTALLKSRRYEGLVWFMQSMGFCSISKLKMQKQSSVVEYRKDFQINLLRAAFSLVCKRTNNIGRYHLASYANVFRIIYEIENRDRREICNRAVKMYEDLYRRCHVDEPEESPLELFYLKCNAQNDTIIQTRTFFTRFSRSCNTFQQFFEKHYSTGLLQSNNEVSSSTLGQALANDTEFINGLSGFLKRAILRYSNLPNLVLKTRLLLQHFSLATIQLSKKMQEAYKCKLRESSEYFNDNGELSMLLPLDLPLAIEAILDNSTLENNETLFNSTNNTETVSIEQIYLQTTLATNTITFYTTDFLRNNILLNTTVVNDSEGIEQGNDVDECANYDSTFYENLNIEALEEFETLGRHAHTGVYIEMSLLLGIVINSLILSFLLYQTRKHLSTATILFVFNILFSNTLFVASFLCLFSDMITGNMSYGSVEELSLPMDASLLIAETLQTHLYAPSEFLKNLTQETLFSLAQNGSLLGFTHLLVLVLVVINRSMSGKAIKLSRRYVISVFSLVWLFLIVTHILFSALQYSAIKTLDRLFSKVASTHGAPQCNRKSDFSEIGEHCDLISVFHDFGVYLLRGHTLFTLSFLSISIIVFIITFVCHWRVRSQHVFLSPMGKREHSPHRTRETLFNTLLLSIGAYFISVLGQSFVEIAVFWVDDRADVARLATFYQITRIVAFVDPLLNPILVAVRTPTMRRRLRLYFCVLVGIMYGLFCPWSSTKFWQISARRKGYRENYRSRNFSSKQSAHQNFIPNKPSSASALLTPTTCVTNNNSLLFLSSYSRRASSSTFMSNDSEVAFKFFCTKQFVRKSILRRYGLSSTKISNSIV